MNTPLNRYSTKGKDRTGIVRNDTAVRVSCELFYIACGDLFAKCPNFFKCYEKLFSPRENKFIFAILG